MLVLVAVNLISIYGGIITGGRAPGLRRPLNLGLAGATVVFTALFVRVLPGTLSQLAVLFGAGRRGARLVERRDCASTPCSPDRPSACPRSSVRLAGLRPAGRAALLLFSVVSMAEATSQTVAIAEIVEREGDAMRLVPRTILGDAAASLLGGCFGTSLIITSGENIGIVQATRVRSRFVTAAAGVILVALPSSHHSRAWRTPFRPQSSVAPRSSSSPSSAAWALTCSAGRVARQPQHVHPRCRALLRLLPILVPGIYGRFPPTLQIILGNGLAMGTLMAVLFQHRVPSSRAASARGTGEVPHRAA